MPETSSPEPPDAEPGQAPGPSGPDASGVAGVPPEDAAAAGPNAPLEEGLERRAFVRKATTDAVTIAGRFYSLSQILSRSVAAAGQSMVDNLESLRLEQTAAEPGLPAAAVPGDPSAALATPDSPGPESTTAAAASDGQAAAIATPGSPAFGAAGDLAPPAPAASLPGMQPAGGSAVPIEPAGAVAPASPAAAFKPAAMANPKPARRALPALTDSQAALLASARTAVLGVSRAGLGPHLTPAQFHWDGSVFRIPSLGWAARIGNVRKEPRVTLFIEDLETGEFGSIGGTATIAEGHNARGESDELLAKYHADSAPDERWAQLVAEDLDRVVIIIDPDQAIWGRRG